MGLQIVSEVIYFFHHPLLHTTLIPRTPDSPTLIPIAKRSRTQSFLNFSSFKHSLLLFIRPTASPIYNIQHSHGLKLLTRLNVGLSQLCEYKFPENFNHTIDPVCSCITNLFSRLNISFCNSLTTHTLSKFPL